MNGTTPKAYKGNVRFSNFSFPEFKSLPVKAVKVNNVLLEGPIK
jgi:hypothetical protein